MSAARTVGAPHPLQSRFPMKYKIKLGLTSPRKLANFYKSTKLSGQSLNSISIALFRTSKFKERTKCVFFALQELANDGAKTTLGKYSPLRVCRTFFMNLFNNILEDIVISLYTAFFQQKMCYGIE